MLSTLQILTHLICATLLIKSTHIDEKSITCQELYSVWGIMISEADTDSEPMNIKNQRKLKLTVTWG